MLLLTSVGNDGSAVQSQARQLRLHNYAKYAVQGNSSNIFLDSAEQDHCRSPANHGHVFSLS